MKITLSLLVVALLALPFRLGAVIKFDPYFTDGVVLPTEVSGGALVAVVTGTATPVPAKIRVIFGEKPTNGERPQVMAVLTGGDSWRVEITRPFDAAETPTTIEVEGLKDDGAIIESATPLKGAVFGQVSVVLASPDILRIPSGTMAKGGRVVRVGRPQASGVSWTAFKEGNDLDLSGAIAVAMGARARSVGAIGVIAVEARELILSDTPPPNTPAPSAPPPPIVPTRKAALENAVDTLVAAGVTKLRSPHAFICFVGRHDASNTAWQVYLARDDVMNKLPSKPEELARIFKVAAQDFEADLNHNAFTSEVRVIVGPWIPQDKTGWLDRYGAQAVQNGLAMARSASAPAIPTRLVIPSEAERLPFANPVNSKQVIVAARRLADSIAHAAESE